MANILLRPTSNVRTLFNSTNFAGSDCTGTTGALSRTLDTSESDIFQVTLERQILHPTLDYTISGTTITFNIKVYNQMNITVFHQ